MKPLISGVLVGAPVAIIAYFVNGWILMDVLPEYGDYPKFLAVTISFLLLAMSIDSCRINTE